MARLGKARKELLTAMMKDSIFDAAVSVLCEYGVDGATMNRVAEAADVAKSSLYDYFRNKEELLAFVHQRIAGPFMETLEAVVAADMPAPKKLEAILRAAYERSSKYKSLLRLLVQSDEDQQMRKKFRPHMLETFTTIFEQGIREGSFHEHNPAHTSRMFLGALAELFELQASTASDEAVSDYVSALIDMVVHGLTLHIEKGGPSNNTSLGSSSS